MKFEKDKSKNWRKYIDKRRSFFETEIGGRKVKVRVYFREDEKNREDEKRKNIVWYLVTRQNVSEQDKGKQYSTPWLRLDDWRQLGFLCLSLSNFCIENRYMNEESFEKIQSFKKKWDNLVESDFQDLKSGKSLMKELEEKLL